MDAIVCRPVWYFPPAGDLVCNTTGHGEPLAALMVRVHADGSSTLAVFDGAGSQFAVTGVPFVQNGGERPREGAYACPVGAALVDAAPESAPAAEAPAADPAPAVQTEGTDAPQGVGVEQPNAPAADSNAAPAAPAPQQPTQAQVDAAVDAARTAAAPFLSTTLADNARAIAVAPAAAAAPAAPAEST